MIAGALKVLAGAVVTDEQVAPKPYSPHRGHRGQQGPAWAMIVDPDEDDPGDEHEAEAPRMMSTIDGDVVPGGVEVGR